MRSRLIEARIRRGWSKAELARRSGLNATTIGQIEAGRFKPYPSQLRKLANVFGWSAEELNDLVERINNPPSVKGTAKED